MASSPAARLRPFKPLPFGRYTLLAQLTSGGMGEIYLARLEGPKGFEKLCVIKKILPQVANDREFLQRFVNEAQTLVKLQHGCIAQVLDVGLHQGEPFIALEYVDGKDMRKVMGRCREEHALPPITFSLYVVGRVLDALAYIHRKRDEDDRPLHLVHRDVSPQNIVVSYEGEIKLIDFGLAKSDLSTAKTNPSMLLGKFLYMAPEQVRHAPIDRRTDLYSVGLCLYELVAGSSPFEGIAPGDLVSHLADPQIVSLEQVAPNCPVAVAKTVMQALAKEPDQRFQTAEEFRAKLLAARLELDPSAGPENVSEYMRSTFASDYEAERRLLTSFREPSIRSAPRLTDVGPEELTQTDGQPRETPPSFLFPVASAIPPKLQVALPAEEAERPRPRVKRRLTPLDEVVTELDVHVIREGPVPPVAAPPAWHRLHQWGHTHARRLIELLARIVRERQTYAVNGRRWLQAWLTRLDQRRQTGFDRLRAASARGTEKLRAEAARGVLLWHGLERNIQWALAGSLCALLLLGLGLALLIQARPTVRVTTETSARAPEEGTHGTMVDAPLLSVPMGLEEPDVEDIVVPLASPRKKRAKPGVADPSISQEWNRLKVSFERLERNQGCEASSIKLLCTRFETLRQEVTVSNGDAQAAQKLLPRMRKLASTLAQKQK